ncbi:Muconolactone Delta-isomerase [Corynebacterium faecale]|uniref:muconolactone Delta-isomerase n=1 Tax=Corynebacterium faecale TaxID=1758466 RepID=UPI0025B6146C|nr:muconolactone Delta-isomerase [Corynebacterium faecale]WJY92926.1 Muconolactone Delta-isomerase [Corynebacterium faecale]
MLFHARMDVHFPESMTPEVMADFQVKEKAYSGDLQSRGIMKAIWRVVGEYANYSIFEVDDHDELQAILSGFPMFKYMDVKITPLAKHPNALEYYLKG